MSRPEKRAKSRWRARYYGPDGKQRSKTFKSEREAQLFLASQEVSKARGEWTDPALGKTTVGEWAERWFATTAALKPKTRADYRSLLDTHVLPTFGNVPLAHLEPIAVREWVARLRLSPSRTRRAYIVLALVCKSAVESGRIATSPCVGVRLPRVQAAEQIIITEDQVSALADVCIGYSELVHVLAYGGLRWAEAVGLRKGRVDPLRSRVHVVETTLRGCWQAVHGPAQVLRTPLRQAATLRDRDAGTVVCRRSRRTSVQGTARRSTQGLTL
jgi:integrase